VSERTPQEAFWAGEFGTEYTERNAGEALMASNVRFFARALAAGGAVASCLELGANRGLNLSALRVLFPRMTMQAVEINGDAARRLGELIGPDNVFTGSLYDFRPADTFDLVLVKGVLIHLHPDRLPEVYETIHRSSRRLILIAEYYNPSPVSVPYRGHADRLFKRDFAGEMLDRFPDLVLRDYGFAYRRDPAGPQDDVTWFLLEKRAAR
jgi:spore coat polysaccharide biosynthesis protein SpsF